MKKTVHIRNIVLGEGIPKICVPVLGSERNEILQSARQAAGTKPDLVEWRVDFFEEAKNPEKVCGILKELGEVLEQIPLLFTFRTAQEGGEKAISNEEYINLYLRVFESGKADAIDVEAFLGEETVRTLIGAAGKRNTKVILSNHDFEKTPPGEELIRRLEYMQELGADIAKIAVMPACTQDVLVLLAATEEAKRTLKIPVITMSMGRTGAVSRFLGETFGSALTFGTGGAASAPGQIPAGELRKILQAIHLHI
ncbi:MAG: type I 3-dehydroquinate dehydratase [Eubacteriales bacterium]|nr:type I 3-dehydroquinate dehydratase [Eubacteriales bacterium]